MARYIDADKMREDWLENGENEYVYDTNAVLDSIDAQPTADVVEVVRCEKCEHKVDYKGRVMCGRRAIKYDSGWAGLTATDKDHFCSYGKRKDGEET